MNESNTGKLADNNTALVGPQQDKDLTLIRDLKEDFLSGAVMITSETDEERLQELQEKHKGVRFITPDQAMAIMKGQELASFKGKETRQLLSELKKQAIEITNRPHETGIYQDGQTKRRNKRKNKNKRNPSVYELLKKKTHE